MNCSNCLNMKGKRYIEGVFFKCIFGVHLTIEGKDKFFRKYPTDKYLRLANRTSWLFKDDNPCLRFNDIEEFNNQKDPCIGCECTGYPCKEIA